MSDWKDAFGKKLVSAAEAVSVFASGMTAVCSLTEPSGLCVALGQREDVENVTVVSAVLLPGGASLTESGRFRVITGFATPVSYPLQEKRLVEYIPLQFSQAHRWVESQVRPDVVMVRLTPPDAGGMCSYGWAPGFTPDLVRLAGERGLPLLAEIDATMPYTVSEQQVPIERITYAVEASAPPAGGDVPALASEKSGAMAVHLNPLIPDGSTIQVGIGSVPDAAVSLLVDKNDLGIHTEVLNEGLIELMEAGVATNARKSFRPGQAVCTICAMSDKIHAFVDRNPRVLVMSSREALDPRVIAQNPLVRCINSAFQVDLLGQVNAETIGGFQVAGVGGQLDFFRGAGLADDALSIVVMDSTTSDESRTRIVPAFEPGSVVTSTRYDVDYAVTEHGVARLNGATTRERALGLISVADPKFRDELEAAAREMRLL
ncbi:MAG: acetyl-CoA hydrolase/transferase C-terminal domain-containing protein [Dehalococcoidia bacterium]|nr:acetyl-CoA hydrolase/transferase C-terminal domain-containing protein [Dehalococcoidia bacterium]